MELTATNICDRTWCIHTPRAEVPFYQLDRGEIILLDSGGMLHGELEQWLEDQRLHVQAILNTHYHWDHLAANPYLHREHGARVYMPKIEAELYGTALGRYLAHRPGNYELLRSFWERFVTPVEVEVDGTDGPLEVCGAVFQVIQTPGHSIGHVSYGTPDNVLYVGDTLMSLDQLRVAKVSYAISHEEDLRSKEKLRAYPCGAYILAHAGVERDIGPVIDANIRYVHQRADTVYRLVERPMSMEEIVSRAWRAFGLREGSYYKNLETGTMLRVLVQYLVSEGRLTVRHKDGVDFYARSREGEDNGTETH